MLPIDEPDLNANPTDPLALPDRRAELAREILKDIDQYCVDTYDDGHRGHLGASLIGDDCERKLWNIFRWLKAEKFTGRMLRLFQRGHIEEKRFVEYLVGIGAQVVEFQPDADGNQDKGAQQYRISAVMGHFGGSLDGQIMLPLKYLVPFAMLSEYKTKGTGPGFKKLVKNGVKLEAPVHYSQMCMYGRHYNYKYGLYMCVNKNDDDLHIEIVELDFKLGAQLEEKAEYIITSQRPPAGVSQNPAFFKCKMCTFNQICFGTEEIERNCRSCRNAKPIEGAQWHCDVHGSVIPKDFIKQTCNCYAPIV